MDEIIETTAVDDWAEIEALFKTHHGVSAGSWSMLGMSSRLGRGRLSRLFKHPAAGSLAAKMDQMGDERVKALRTIAAVNYEQVSAAFRFTLVANVTAPVLILTLANMLLKGGIGQLLRSLYGGDSASLILFLVASGFALIGLVFLLMWAIIQLNQARDIRHLIDVFAAQRGIYFGLEDAGDPTAQ